MKKTLCLTIALLCTLFCGCVKESPEPVFTPPTIAPEKREKTGDLEYAGLIFSLYNDYTCELVGPSETADHANTLVIPDKYEDYTLVRICKNAFAGTSFSHITIPDSVKHIDDYAFQKCEIHQITLPKNLETLGVECFDNCLNLEEVTFQNSIKIIPTAAFYGCEKLKKVILPEGVKIIGEEAFASLKQLETITLPESLEEIGPFAFWSSGTEQLKLTVPKGVKSIGKDAFANSKAQITYLSEENTQ